jgi:hypothetical protein
VKKQGLFLSGTKSLFILIAIYHVTIKSKEDEIRLSFLAEATEHVDKIEFIFAELLAPILRKSK